MFLDIRAGHDDLCFLVLRRVLRRDSGDAALFLDRCLHAFRDASAGGIAFKAAHLDFMVQAPFHEPWFHDLRVRIVAYDILDIEVFAILVGDGHDAVVRAAVLRIAYGQDGVRLAFRQRKIPSQFADAVKQALPFDRLVHVQRAPGCLVHDLALLAIERGRKAHAVLIVEIAFVILVQRWNGKEHSPGIIRVLAFKTRDRVAGRPVCGYVQFLAVITDLALPEICSIGLPQTVQAFA